MKKLLIISTILLASCTAKQSINHKDSTECAVFEGYPAVHEADFETQAVFIPVDELAIYSTGQTVYIDSDGYIVEPIRDAESKQFIIPAGADHVVLHDRVLPNRYKLIKQ